MRAVNADFKEAPKTNSALSGFAIVGLVIIILCSLVGAFAWGVVQFPYVPPPDPTPLPTQAPATVVNASTPTPTPLPAGMEKRYYVGQWGPTEVLVYNITKNTTVRYDPNIGYRDDLAMLMYGYSGNHKIIPAVLNDGSQINMGYYDVDAGVFCYAYPINNKTVIIEVDASSIERARLNDTYGVGNIIIGPDGLIYAEDSEGNIVRLKDGKAVSFEEISLDATVARQLRIDWQGYVGRGDGPDTSSGYSTPTPTPTITPTPTATPTPTPTPTPMPTPTPTPMPTPTPIPTPTPTPEPTETPIINGSQSYTP